jgi:predicted CXXCH cytochrome family protein
MLVLLLSVPLFIVGRGVAGEEPAEHPYIEPGQIKSATCLMCHASKQEGKFVHPAIAMGCESCHQVSSEHETTAITLVAPPGKLCAKCHELKEARVVHGPYKNVQCVICHNPHSSEFPANTRAETNTLCLSCHGVDRPSVKVNAATQTVDLLGGQTLNLAEYRRAPKISLDPTGRFGHPWTGHPVAERPDPLRPGEKMSCLSCHTPHTSDLVERIRTPAKGKPDICDACHEAVERQKAEQQHPEDTTKTLSGGKNP